VDQDVAAAGLFWLISIAAWFGLALMVGNYAKQRGRYGFGWWLLSLFVSPLITFLILALLEPGTQGKDYRRCPFCAEQVKSAAIVCRYCSRDLPPIRLRDDVGAGETEQVVQLHLK
jgi:hypothetical protein